MSPITTILQERRSHYPSEFNGQTIEKETILEILANAHWAPSHLNTFPWRFIVMAGTQLHQWGEFALGNSDVKPGETAESHKKRIIKLQQLANVSHAVAIVCHFSELNKPPRQEEICSVACAVQNMYLSLDSYTDTGGYWSTGYGTYKTEMADYFGLKGNEILMGFFMLGKVNTKRTASKRSSYENHIKWL